MKHFITTLLCLSILITEARSGTVITGCSYTFCEVVYPSPFVNGSIKIAASTAGAFGANQAVKHMDIIVPANFNFNTSAGADVSFAANQSITYASAQVLNSRRIRLTISTANVAGKFDTMVISFQMRAVTAPITSTSSTVMRSDSTDLATASRFKIDGSTGLPNSSLGRLNSRFRIMYSSSEATHPTTSVVYSSTNNNQMLRVSVVLTGTCGSATVSSFTFNTDGGNGLGSTNAAGDITTAKVFYTGTSTTFSTSNLFGSQSAPNGSFTITGTRTITAAGTYYFWLTYDISNTATSGNLVDAQISSLNISGTNYTNTSNPAPTDSRTIATQYFYSRATGSWSTTTLWSYTDGGASCGCVPNGTAYVVIKSGHTVTVNGSYTADIVDVQSGGTLKDNGTSVLTVKQNLLVSGTGKVNMTSSWALQGNVSLTGSGTSSATKPLSIGGGLVVGSGTTFSVSGTADITVSSDINVNGTLALNTKILTLSGNNSTISGTGTISGSGGVTISNHKMISGESNLTINPPVTLSNNITVTNYGTITLTGNLIGGNTSSTWTNADGSVLNAAAAVLVTGTLDASAPGNVINYNGSAAQTIKSSTYNQLMLGHTTASAKTLGGAITVNDDLTIQANGTLDVSASNFSITLFGDLINNSLAATPLNARNGTITFAGNTQISGVVTLNHITINGALTSNAGNLSIRGNIVNNGIFNHNNGTVIFASASTLSGSSLTVFNNISINASSSFTAHANQTKIVGDFINNGTFNSNNGTMIFEGAVEQIIGGSINSTFFNLEIDAAGVSLARPCTVNSSLILTNGCISTSASNILNLGSNASIDGGSDLSYIKGPVTKSVAASGTTTLNVPIGKAARYRPIVLTVNHTNSSAASYTFEMYNTSAVGLNYNMPSGIANVSSARYYKIDRSGAANLIQASVQLSYGEDDGVSDPSNLRIVKNIGTGTEWFNIGGLGTASVSGTITSNAFTSFSTFALANAGGGGNILPVTLSDFYATCSDTGSNIYWVTLSEFNTKLFELQRSLDGILFEKVLTKSAIGYSTTEQQYTAFDLQALNSTRYYRLKIVDNDDTYSYSNVIAVQCLNPMLSYKISIAPNPVHDSFIIEMKPFTNKASYKLYDILGNMKMHGDLFETNPIIHLNNHNIAPGIYYLTVDMDGYTTIEKIIVM